MFNKFKKWLSKNPYPIVLVLAIVAISITATVFASAKDKQLPVNPLKNDLDSSQVVLAGQDQKVSDELRKSGIKLKPSDKASDKDGEEGKSKDESKKEDSKNNNNNNSLTGSDKASNKIISPSGKETETNNNYFTTTIKNGETVKNETYKFKIIQKKHRLKVNSQKVFVNGEEVAFKNSIFLKFGTNEIKIVVNYQGEDGKSFDVSKDYLVNYTIDAKIVTTLEENQEVSDSSFEFKAYVEKNKEKKALKVLHNDKEIKESGQFRYNVKLEEGENKFQLVADNDGSQLRESYLITYTPKKDSEEDDVDKETEEENEENPDDGYEGKFNENGPIIEIKNLEDGGSYIGNKHSFEVQVTSHSGEDIALGNGQPGYTVELNDNLVSANWVNDRQTSFTADFVEGNNILIVKAVDANGEKNAKKIEMTASKTGDGEVSGSATISVEATTVGFGYLVPPMEIPVRNNVPAAFEVIDLLQKTGFDYGNTGQPDKAFYLGHISALDGNFWGSKKPRIPTDLKELLYQEGFVEPSNKEEFENDTYETAYKLEDRDGLGEFDFTTGSGWMYSVNGIYPNVGFADYFLKDGDTVRVRFTLMYGSDIGGASSTGMGVDFDNEW